MNLGVLTHAVEQASAEMAAAALVLRPRLGRAIAFTHPQAQRLQAPDLRNLLGDRHVCATFPSQWPRHPAAGRGGEQGIEPSVADPSYLLFRERDAQLLLALAVGHGPKGRGPKGRGPQGPEADGSSPEAEDAGVENDEAPESATPGSAPVESEALGAVALRARLGQPFSRENLDAFAVLLEDVVGAFQSATLGTQGHGPEGERARGPRGEDAPGPLESPSHAVAAPPDSQPRVRDPRVRDPRVRDPLDVTVLDPKEPRALINLFGDRAVLAVSFLCHLEGFGPVMILRVYPDRLSESARPPESRPQTFTHDRATVSTRSGSATRSGPATLRGTPPVGEAATQPGRSARARSAQTPKIVSWDRREPEAPKPSTAPVARPLRGAARMHPEMHRILRIELPVRVTVAKKTMTIGEVLDLAVGSVIEFDKPVDTPLALEVQGRPIAQGRAVVKNERFALELSRVVALTERLVPED